MQFVPKLTSPTTRSAGLTLRQADQARDDFAQILDALDFVYSQLAPLPTRSELTLIIPRHTHARRRGRDRPRLVSNRIIALGVKVPHRSKTS